MSTLGRGADVGDADAVDALAANAAAGFAGHGIEANEMDADKETSAVPHSPYHTTRPRIV